MIKRVITSKYSNSIVTTISDSYFIILIHCHAPGVHKLSRGVFQFWESHETDLSKTKHGAELSRCFLQCFKVFILEWRRDVMFFFSFVFVMKTNTIFTQERGTLWAVPARVFVATSTLSFVGDCLLWQLHPINYWFERSWVNLWDLHSHTWPTDIDRVFPTRSCDFLDKAVTFSGSGMEIWYINQKWGFLPQAP